MAKADLGTKRVCPNCGTRYYDLNRVPIICPKCGTQFEIPAGRARPQAAAVVEEEDTEEVETEGAEMISLEEADAEAAGDTPEEEGDDIEVGEEGEEDVFLEEEEEEGDDVTDIIGDVDDEER